MKRLALLCAFALALCTTAACARSAGSCPLNAVKQPTEPLTIATKGGQLQFCVAVARTSEEQARGLMFRDRLAPREGMIFPLDEPRVASFWMKNTVIPLDIIFVRGDGTISNIAAQTVPYSLEPVLSDEPVATVLELAGGQAAALGIAEDDKVVWTGKR